MEYSREPPTNRLDECLQGVWTDGRLHAAGNRYLWAAGMASAAIGDHQVISVIETDEVARTVNNQRLVDCTDRGENGEFDTRVGIAAIDRACEAFLKSGADALELDFAGIEHLDHECLVHLGAIVETLSRNNRDITLNIPKFESPIPSRLVRFLKTRKFPEFAEKIATENTPEVSSESLARSMFVDPDSGQDSTATMNALSGEQPLVEFNRADLLRSTFFLPLSEFLYASSGRDPYSRAKAAQYLIENCSGFMTMLEGDLGRAKAELLPGEIVFEIAHNSALHAGVKAAYVTAQFGRISDKKSPWALEVSVWDNGKTIQKSLRDAAKSGRSLLPEFRGGSEEFWVKFTDTDRDDITIKNGDDVNLDQYADDDSILAVIAFLKGTTSRDPMAPDNRTGLPPGLGLSAVISGVIDQLEGSIKYVSGPYRIEIRERPDGKLDTYDVSVEEERFNVVGSQMHIKVDLPL